jgi:hypothetical protein
MRVRLRCSLPQTQYVSLILLLAHGRATGHLKFIVDLESRQVLHQVDRDVTLFKDLKTLGLHTACLIECLRCDGKQCEENLVKDQQSRHERRNKGCQKMYEVG